MRISKNATVDDIENLYKKVENFDQVLQVPNGFKSLRIGLVARLSQFFITIAKQRNVTFSFPWVDVDKESSIEKIIEDPCCLTALLMSDHIVDKDHVIIKSKINSKLVNRFDESIFKKGRKLQMMAVDHSIAKYATPECFYGHHDGVPYSRNSSYYYEIISGFIKDRAKQSDLKYSEHVGLGELLSELIDNTDQHARLDYQNGLSSKSVRSVVLNCHQITTGQDLLKICGDGNSISNYVSSLTDRNRSFNLLEISINDSGPGYYHSFNYLREKPTLSEEADILFRCFSDGVTSKVNGVGVGRGLDKAIHILNDRNGYLGIRAGRLSVYRDYKNLPLDNKGFNGNDLRFNDEVNGSLSRNTEMEFAEGVSYTILVPLL
jgi:hypothetical protein